MIAHFAKVSFYEYLRAMGMQDAQFESEEYQALRKEWEDIQLPTRATAGSAGYDFYLPRNTCISCDYTDHEGTLVPTGIRIVMEPGWLLALLPRSGLGFKNGFRLANTVGIIDSDYSNADNEGHIMAKVLASKPLALHKGDRFLQGILIPYGLAGEEVMNFAARTGGFGSTGGIA